jgi:hypothetical protein
MEKIMQSQENRISIKKEYIKELNTSTNSEKDLVNNRIFDIKT